jgi:hypothetical protein
MRKVTQLKGVFCQEWHGVFEPQAVRKSTDAQFSITLVCVVYAK